MIGKFHNKNKGPQTTDKQGYQLQEKLKFLTQEMRNMAICFLSLFQRNQGPDFKEIMTDHSTNQSKDRHEGSKRSFMSNN